MSHKRGTHLGGVRSLQMLMDRCRVDDITDCWEWSGATTSQGYPKLQLPAGIDCDRDRVITAYKAAWILAGNVVPKGRMVYRPVCWNVICCNPAHMKCGTHADMGRDAGKSGHRRGDPVRSVVNRRNSKSQMLPVEKVIEVQEMLRQGHLQKSTARLAGVSKDSVQKIANGRHPHQIGETCRQSSVFSWAAAA